MNLIKSARDIWLFTGTFSIKADTQNKKKCLNLGESPYVKYNLNRTNLIKSERRYAQ